MKIFKVPLLLLTLSLVCVNFADAKSKVKLRLNLKEGDSYLMKTSMQNDLTQEVQDKTIRMEQFFDIDYLMMVKTKKSNGNYVIDYSINDLSMSMKMDGKESKLTADSLLLGDDENGTKQLKDLHFEMEMTPLGKIINISGVDNFLEAYPGAKSNPIFAQSFNSAAMKEMMEKSFNYFPEEEVSVGDKWDLEYEIPQLMKLNVAMSFKLIGIKGNDAEIEVDSTMDSDDELDVQGFKIPIKIKAKQDGEMKIDAKTGLVKDSSLHMIFDMVMNMKNPQDGSEIKIPMKMDTTTEMKFVKQ